MNRNYRRLAISSGAVAVSAALAATSWAAALPNARGIFTGSSDEDTVEELVLALEGAELLSETEAAAVEPEDMTIDQVLALLQRAESARSDGETFNEAAANVAVELATLLDTYLAQQAGKRRPQPSNLRI